MTDRVNEINISEHDSDLYAKRVNLVAGAAYIGLATITVGTNKAWSNPNTYIGLVTASEVPYIPTTSVYGIVSAASGIVNQFPANAIKWVNVKAPAGNSTVVFIGGSTTMTDATGYPLAQSSNVELKVSNTNLLFLKGTDAVNEVRFIGGN